MDALVHPSLQEALARTGMDPALVQLGMPLTQGVAAGAIERGTVHLVAGHSVATWQVPSLKSLFRGTGTPPDLTEYPAEYVPVFFLIERHVVVMAGMSRVPTDAELEEAFANLRRRPDGRSLGPAHDALWQASALALGRFVLSEAEFGAVVGRLSRSARYWKTSLTSRAYITYVSRTFG